MHQVQIFLPIKTPDGRPIPMAEFDRLADELTQAFGGLTAYVRSPADGRWRNAGRTEHDDVVIFEVMTSTIERDWWRALRHRLEIALSQQHVLIRASPIELL